MVLATGGGAFMNEETRSRIAERGISIWLRADLDVLMRRVRKRANRPLLQNADPEGTMRRLMDIAPSGLCHGRPHGRIPRGAARPGRRPTSSRLSTSGSHAKTEGALHVTRAAAGSDSPSFITVPVPARRARLRHPGRARPPRRGGRAHRGARRPRRRHRHRRECRAALRRGALRASLEAQGLRTAVVTVPAGEATKSYAGLARVCDAVLAARIERGDLVVALGGGVVGDLAGFAAAVVRRGVRFVQVPTTLLPRSIPPSAARPASTRATARTSSAPSTSRASCSPTRRSSTRCRRARCAPATRRW